MDPTGTPVAFTPQPHGSVGVSVDRHVGDTGGEELSRRVVVVHRHRVDGGLVVRVDVVGPAAPTAGSGRAVGNGTPHR